MHHRSTVYALALFIGLAFTAWLFPRQLLFPVNYYDMAAVGDTADHIIGQRYFLLGRWEWPPLQAPLLRWPIGTNIALTDSIPLLAIPGKIFRRVLPQGFHSIFWFLAIAWCLQPIAGVYALRSTGEKRLLPSLSAALIVLSMVGKNYRLTRDMEDAAAELKLPRARTPIILRQVYADAPGQGTVVWHMGARAQEAADEIRQLFREIMQEAGYAKSRRKATAQARPALEEAE